MSGGGRKGGGGVRQRVVVPPPPPFAIMPSLPYSLPRSLAPSFLPPLPSPALPWQKWVCASWGCAISQPLHWLTWSGGMRGGREGGMGRPAGWPAGSAVQCAAGCGSPFPENAARLPRVCDKIGIGASGLGVSASLSPSAVCSSHKGEPNGGKRQSVFLADGRAEVMADRPTAVRCTGLCFGCSKKKKRKKKTAQEFTRCFNRTLQNCFFFFLLLPTWLQKLAIDPESFTTAPDNISAKGGKGSWLHHDTWLLLSVCPAIPAVIVGGNSSTLYIFIFPYVHNLRQHWEICRFRRECLGRPTDTHLSLFRIRLIPV